jgi:hypothetical protein
VVASAREAQRLARGGTWPYTRMTSEVTTPCVGLAESLAARLRD